MQEPRNAVALAGAGRLAFALGDYAKAHRLMERAVRVDGAGDDTELLDESERILQLEPSETLPLRERVARILAARRIARARLDGCSAADGSLEGLRGRWAGEEGTSTARSLLQDDERRTTALRLVYDTEVGTSTVCAAPMGDDALLLRLAKARELGGVESVHPTLSR